MILVFPLEKLWGFYKSKLLDGSKFWKRIGTCGELSSPLTFKRVINNDFYFSLILQFGIQRRLKTSSYNDDIDRENKNTKKKKKNICQMDDDSDD